MALKRFLVPSKSEPSNKKLCILKSISNDLLDIELSSSDAVSIGRSEKTGITDTGCSRQQILLKPDFTKSAVSICVKGLNPSGLNGFRLENGIGYEAYEDDIIEVVYGKFSYKVKFVDGEVKSTKVEMGESSKNSECIDENEPLPVEMKGRIEPHDDGKLYIYTTQGSTGSDKIASFDLDGTLIKTKSGRVFPKNIDDWQIAFPEVPGALKSLHKDGYKIVIFTNQAGISSGKMKIQEFKHKITGITQKLNVPVQCFIATTDNFYRKPKIGMWNHMENNENNGVIVDRNKSFFVGDAAGRMVQDKIAKSKKDHSCADRLFAINLGLPFHTPEEYFLKKTPLPYVLPEFNPKDYRPRDLLIPRDAKIMIAPYEMIVMVGLPGSGKSTFVRKYLAKFDYVIVNRDTLGTAQACMKLCEETIAMKKSVVIDNTNVDVETRSRYINLAKSKNVRCRCFVMNVAPSHLKHNIIFRELTDKNHVRIPAMVFNSIKKKYKEPELSEGFEEIIKVNIMPEFRSREDEKLYRMYLVED